jgi:hypothetical protein
MPGIDLKQMWKALGQKLLTVWKFFSDWLSDPFEVLQRGLVASGVLSPALTKGALGFIWGSLRLDRAVAAGDDRVGRELSSGASILSRLGSAASPRMAFHRSLGRPASAGRISNDGDG